MRKLYKLFSLLFCLPFTVISQTWTVDNTSDPAQQCYLYGIKAISDTDIWSVGFVNDNGSLGSAGFNGPLFEHWNGTTWTTIQTPTTWNFNHDNGTQYYSIDGTASNDLWAAGIKYPDASVSALHYTGNSWDTVNLPQASWPEELHAVKCFSSSDVWMIGYSPNSIAFTLHWNGTSWSKTSCDPLFSGGTQYSLVSLDGTSSSDLWAAGYFQSQGNTSNALIEHWDGSAWTIIPSPNAGSYLSRLESIYAVDSDNVWAAGHYSDDFGSTYKNLIMHWNGLSWTQIIVPDEGTAYNLLYSIKGSGPDDIWAAGIFTEMSVGEFSTTTLHFDGTSWSIIPSPDPYQYSNQLKAVTVLPDGRAWSAGFRNRVFFTSTTDQYYTLVERLDTNSVQTSIGSVENYKESMLVYPSPASDFIMIESCSAADENLSVTIVDARGKSVRNIAQDKLPASESVKIDVHDLSNGIYFLRIVNGNHFQSFRVIKQD